MQSQWTRLKLIKICFYAKSGLKMELEILGHFLISFFNKKKNLIDDS